jgi:hypothetical protein
VFSDSGIGVMSFFVVRIELHNATGRDYDVLHAAMQHVGFHVRITHRGVTYHLPTAEYAVNSDQSTAQVLDAAKAAATTTRKAFCAIVVKSAEFDQFNLPQNGS